MLVAQNISRVNCPRLAKTASLKTHTFAETDHRQNIFSNLSSGQQDFLNDIRQFGQKRLVKKSKFVLRKKNSPSSNIRLLSLHKSEQLLRIYAF